MLQFIDKEASMSSIDDIKKKLEIDKLDPMTRKEMFNKFIEKGGRVIEERESKGRFNREKYLLKLQEEKLKKYNENRSKDNFLKKETDEELKRSFYKKKRYFSVYLSGMFTSTFSITGYFTKKFSHEMSETLKEIILELQQVVAPLLSIKEEKKWELMDVINLKNPFAYEILIRYNELLTKEELELLIGYFKIQNFVLCPNLLKVLMNFFKKLVILYPYWETCKTILWEGELYYQDITGISPILTKSKISKNIDKLFAYYLPRIFLILCYNYGFNYEFNYNNAFKLANINNEEDIGSITRVLTEEKKDYYKKLAKEKEQRMQQLKKEIEQKELEKVPKYVLKGLELIEEVIQRNLEKQPENIFFNYIDKNEKMFYFLSIFDEFDKEYSFLLTTSQVKYDVKHLSGSKIDVKDELNNLYIKFNEILTLIKEYVKLNQNYQEVEHSELMNVMSREQELNKIDVKRTQTFYEIRNRAGLFFRNFANVMQTIITDYEGERMILKNGEERLHFELIEERTPKFENVKIITAIILAFSFSSAIYYYLTKGKLCSKGLYLEE